MGGDVNAVQHFSKESLFAFGWGDFGVKENCDQHYENWSNYGVTKFTKHSFALPLSVEPDTNKAYTYLAGAHRFKVSEIEVYRVNFIKKVKS